MSRQTSTRVLVQLWCLLAVAAFANATSVASRISKHALAANPAATRSVTRTLRQAAQVARAAPVAAERRGLAESDFSMCEYLGDSISCSFAADHGACVRKSGCEWDGFSCGAEFDDEAFSAELISDLERGMDQLTTCMLLVDDASACDAEENCEANPACNPTEAFMESTISDPVMAQIMHKTFVCRSIDDDANECNSQANCEFDYFEGSCVMSDEAVESIIFDALLKCNLDTSIADGAGAVVAVDVDLCPVAEAQIECMQFATEAACDTATKCEWSDPDASEDPYEKKYPCSAKDEHMEPILEVLEANYGVALRAFRECANEYTSESACEGDEECTWNGDDNVCAPSDLKIYRALGNSHPHFARYYQIDATCGSLGQSACGNGDSANKCAWSAASVGGDAECVPTIETFAEVMSCECSTEIAAAAPTVDTSSADCTAPEVPEWLTTTPAPAIETATASNCEDVCQGHGYNQDQCVAVSDSCVWNNGRCWSGVGPNRCDYFTVLTDDATSCSAHADCASDEYCYNSGYRMTGTSNEIGYCSDVPGDCCAGAESDPIDMNVTNCPAASRCRQTATASNCEDVCEGHGHTRDQCLDVSDGCEWDNGRCWSRVGPNRCVYFTDAVQLLEPSRSAAFQIFDALFAIVTLCAFAIISH